MKARAGKKRVVLELGGNAAAVLEDFRGPAELDAIIPKLIFGAFYQSGQSCISLQRLFVRHVSASALSPHSSHARPAPGPHARVSSRTLAYVIVSAAHVTGEPMKAV